MNDSELLHAWASRRDEAAFAELVRRHLNLVHTSARRQVGASFSLAEVHAPKAGEVSGGDAARR